MSASSAPTNRSSRSSTADATIAAMNGHAVAAASASRWSATCASPRDARYAPTSRGSLPLRMAISHLLPRIVSVRRSGHALHRRLVTVRKPGNRLAHEAVAADECSPLR